MTTQIKGDATSTFGSDIDVTGNVVTDAPIFGAYQSTSQTVTTGTFTKVTFTTEEFDTNSDFASSRFTPTVEGYYQINSVVSFNTSNGQTIATIYKNGSEFKRGNTMSDSATASARAAVVSSIVYANGTTDYFEIYCYHTRGSNATTRNQQKWTYVNGVLVRAV